MTLHHNIETKQHHDQSLKDMRRLEESNIAAAAPAGIGDCANKGISFRFRQRPTALELLNRGLSNWYPGTAEQLVWKAEEEQIEFERKMHVLVTNSNVFQRFKDRVAASESFGNPMAARLILEEFLEQELLFVGKRGVIHRHSELIKHLALTQRSPASNSSNNKMPLRNPTADKNSLHHETLHSSAASIAKSDSLATADSSDSSISEDYSNSPAWSPQLSGKKTVTFSSITNLSEKLHVPVLDEGNLDLRVTEGSLVN